MRIVLSGVAAAFGLLLVTAGTARGHDIYTDWKIPGSDVSCCSESDCRPVTAEFRDDGFWWAKVDGVWVQVPADKVLPPGTSHDGRSHYCGASGLTFCFTPGEIRS